MKKTAGSFRSIIISVVSALILFAGITTSVSMAADATVSVDIASAYVWRGQSFNDGAVIQSSIDVSAENGLGFNVWGNYDVDDYNGTVNSREFSEVDLTASYGFSLGKVDMGVGIISYLFPAGTGETAEVYVSMGYEIVDGLSAGIDAYYDIDAIKEFTYATLSLSYGFDVTEKLGLEVGGSVGYAGDDFVKAGGGDDGGFYDYTVSISLGYTISDAWSISAGATYVDAINDDNLKEKTAGGNLDVNTVFSMGLSCSF